MRAQYQRWLYASAGGEVGVVLPTVGWMDEPAGLVRVRGCDYAFAWEASTGVFAMPCHGRWWSVIVVGFIYCLWVRVRVLEVCLGWMIC